MKLLHAILDRPLFPEAAPIPCDDWTDGSSLTLSILEGPSLDLWSIATVVEGRTKKDLALRLQPDQTVVIGRQEGGEIEYLDPRYHPTQMVPNSNRPVVTTLNRGADVCVSRGHFMLKGSMRGILLVNGVPRRGGGIRPPKNGTMMLEPVCRALDQGEEYMIERGAAAKIALPNGTVILLRAEEGVA